MRTKSGTYISPHYMADGLWTQWWYFPPLRVELNLILVQSTFEVLLNVCCSHASVLEACLLCSHRLFGGLVLDIKRKAPWYWSDYQDALSLQCLASFLFLYCACMSPVITFGGLLGEATEGRIVRTFNHYSWSQRRHSILWWLPCPLGEKLPGLGLRTPVFLLNYYVFWFHTKQQHGSCFRADSLQLQKLILPVELPVAPRIENNIVKSFKNKI